MKSSNQFAKRLVIGQTGANQLFRELPEFGSQLLVTEPLLQRPGLAIEEVGAGKRLEAAAAGAEDSSGRALFSGLVRHAADQEQEASVGGVAGQLGANDARMEEEDRHRTFGGGESAMELLREQGVKSLGQAVALGAGEAVRRADEPGLGERVASETARRGELQRLRADDYHATGRRGKQLLKQQLRQVEVRQVVGLESGFQLVVRLLVLAGPHAGVQDQVVQRQA